MKRAIVTGAAGFAGYSLTDCLSRNGYKVFAIVKPESDHNMRLNGLLNVTPIECDLSEYDNLPKLINEACDVFFHMAWSGVSGDDFESQKNNIAYSIKAVESAAELGCSRYVAAGSQAEYGVVSPDCLITEELPPKPISAYGAAKVAACHLTKIKASEYGIEWLWGRIFSLYGKYEPSGRMLPDLIAKLKLAATAQLSSCRQNWDYLDVFECAEAFVALAKKGRSGEIYNVADGRYKPLKEYTESLLKEIGTGSIVYGDDPEPFVSLQPDIAKIAKDTDWKADKKFSLCNY